MHRDDFPQLVEHPSLIYLDSANTSLKPQAVIDSVISTYTNYANVSRGSYSLSEDITKKFEDTRHLVAQLINAQSDEIVFTHSTTYGINQIAYGISHLLNKDDIILLSIYEHNSNIVSWNAIAQSRNAKVVFFDPRIPLPDKYSDQVKILSLTAVSNLTGECLPIKKILSEAQRMYPDIFTVVDACQAISKIAIDVRSLNVSALTFSSHKLYGPSGVGILYLSKTAQEQVRPTLLGSQAVESYDDNKFTLKDTVAKFEPGTPNIEGVIGFGASLRYLNSINLKNLHSHDQRLTDYFNKKARKLTLNKYILDTGLNGHAGLFSLQSEVHPHDIAAILDTKYSISVRSGLMCSHHPALLFGSQAGFIRASFGIYTNEKDIDAFLLAYSAILDRFGGR